MYYLCFRGNLFSLIGGEREQRKVGGGGSEFVTCFARSSELDREWIGFALRFDTSRFKEAINTKPWSIDRSVSGVKELQKGGYISAAPPPPVLRLPRKDLDRECKKGGVASQMEMERFVI